MMSEKRIQGDKSTTGSITKSRGLIVHTEALTVEPAMRNVWRRLFWSGSLNDRALRPLGRIEGIGEQIFTSAS